MSSMVIIVEVEPNGNCIDLPMQVFEATERPWKVAKAKAHWTGGVNTWCRVTGWSSEGGGTPCDARCAKVGDSGAGYSYLVYGGDWGLRLMPADAEESWSISSPRQWGEPYLLLAERQDVEADSEAK